MALNRMTRPTGHGYPFGVAKTTFLFVVARIAWVDMKPSDALTSHRAQVRALTAQFRLSNPRVFGSVLRGTDTDASDLDILVDAAPGATLLDVSGLQVELEDLLGVQVDVLTPADLPIRFRDEVLAEARPV